MIVDLILDRKDGFGYSAPQFYRDVYGYSTTVPHHVALITTAMDYGDEDDVRHALCKYIIQNEYNPRICDYINSVNWLD
jgi:hypothetical protein